MATLEEISKVKPRDELEKAWASFNDARKEYDDCSARARSLRTQLDNAEIEMERKRDAMLQAKNELDKELIEYAVDSSKPESKTVVPSPFDR